MAREGSLEAPTRHPMRWQDPEFTDPDALEKELARVFDVCHGCRRCVNLCQSFPTLFDLIDESETLEVDGVDPADYHKVIDQCYLCDLCYMTKCPYVPPHEWNIDFPHLMLRAKHAQFRTEKPAMRDRILTSPDRMGKFLGIPIVAQAVNAANRSKPVRAVLERATGIHREAALLKFHTASERRDLRTRQGITDVPPTPDDATEGLPERLLIFATCYGTYYDPRLLTEMIEVFEHNGLEVRLPEKELCCGMPKFELGDLEEVQRLKDRNIPVLREAIDRGFALTAPVPSCVLMFRKELPLLFPEDEDVRIVSEHIYDPFEYLALLHQAGRLNTRFRTELGTVVLHSSCHQRVQNFGPKTRDMLRLVPGTELKVLERCSGHDGTYGVRTETYLHSRKICRPLARELDQTQEVDHYGSDCPMAGNHLDHCSETAQDAEHPMRLLHLAYGLASS